MGLTVAFAAGVFVGSFVGMFGLALAIVARERCEEALGVLPETAGREVISIAAYTANTA